MAPSRRKRLRRHCATYSDDEDQPLARTDIDHEDSDQSSNHSVDTNGSHESAEHSESQDEEADEACTICLSDLTDESWLDCCDHSFCFTCIFRWCTDICNNCPLCKQKVTEIRHAGEKRTSRSPSPPPDSSLASALKQWHTINMHRTATKARRHSQHNMLDSSPASLSQHVALLTDIAPMGQRLTRSMAKPIIGELSALPASDESSELNARQQRLQWSRTREARLKTVSISDLKQRVAYDSDESPPSPSILNALCLVCHRDERDDQLLLCDSCNAGYHTYCLALPDVPEGDWFCPDCDPLMDSYVSQPPSPIWESFDHRSFDAFHSPPRNRNHHPPTQLSLTSSPDSASSIRSGPISNPRPSPITDRPSSALAGRRHLRRLGETPVDHSSHRVDSSDLSQASSTAQMRSLRESQRAALLRSQREILSRRPHPYHPSEPVTPTNDAQKASLEILYQSILDQEVARRTGQGGLNKSKSRIQASRRRILDRDEDSGMSSSDEPIRRKIPRKRIPNVIKPIPEIPNTPATPSSVYSTLKEIPKNQWSFRGSSTRSSSPLSLSSIPLSSLASFRSTVPTSLHTIRQPSDLEDRPLADFLRR